MFDPSPGRYSQLRKMLSEVKLLSRGCTVLVEGPRVVAPVCVIPSPMLSK